LLFTPSLKTRRVCLYSHVLYEVVGAEPNSVICRGYEENVITAIEYAESRGATTIVIAPFLVVVLKCQIIVRVAALAGLTNIRYQNKKQYDNNTFASGILGVSNISFRAFFYYSFQIYIFIVNGLRPVCCMFCILLRKQGGCKELEHRNKTNIK
jgi:hypothetical protein